LFQNVEVMMVITSHFNVTVSALFASVLMIMMVMYWQDQRVFAKQQSVLSLDKDLPHLQHQAAKCILT